MNNLYKKIFILLLTGVFTYSSFAVTNSIIPESMLVITSDAKPISNKHYAFSVFNNKLASLEIYNLDMANRFKRKISEGLPKGEAQAKKAFDMQINAMGEDVFSQQTLTAYKGLMLAFKHRVRRYPIIIFNKKSVIYGVTDLKLALQKYHDWEYAKKGVSHE